jgi:hypothetical protein
MVVWGIKVIKMKKLNRNVRLGNLKTGIWLIWESITNHKMYLKYITWHITICLPTYLSN